jgi:ATP-dependent protease ClpP protease subunit
VKTRLINYLIKHWRGDFSLTRSFWVNFVFLFFALDLLERMLFPPFIDDPLKVTIAVLVYVGVVKLIVYPWQVVGVLRSCGKQISADSGRLWAIAAQFSMVASLAIVLISSIETWQSLQIYKQDLARREIGPDIPLYSLDLVKQATLIHLRGPFEIGITASVADLISQNPQVTGIILDSEGGQIYEGRGLARVIRENGLQTFSLDKCLSSCTTAFVAGTTRSLGPQARMGFHQYKTYSLIPSINVGNEQARDKAIFVEQGIAAEFIDKIFEQPPESMWWPETDELLAAGVVHQTGFVLTR